MAKVGLLYESKQLESKEGEVVIKLPMATKITKPDGTVEYDNNKTSFIDIIVPENWKELLKKGNAIKFRFVPRFIELDGIKCNVKFIEDTAQEIENFLNSISKTLAN